MTKTNTSPALLAAHVHIPHFIGNLVMVSLAEAAPAITTAGAVLRKTHFAKNIAEVLAAFIETAEALDQIESDDVKSTIRSLERQRDMELSESMTLYEPHHNAVLAVVADIKHVDDNGLVRIRTLLQVVDGVQVPGHAIAPIHALIDYKAKEHGVDDDPEVAEMLERLRYRALGSSDDLSTSVLDSLNGDDDDALDDIDPPIAAKANGAGVHDHIDPAAEAQRVTG